MTVLKSVAIILGGVVLILLFLIFLAGGVDYSSAFDEQHAHGAPGFRVRLADRPRASCSSARHAIRIARPLVT